MQDGTPIIIKKKKSHGHAHHGGAWKVAYADFVTAMMAFFMVMWILGMSEEQKKDIASYFRDPLGFDKNLPRNPVNILPQESPLPGSGGVTSGDRGRLNDAKEVQDLAGRIAQTISEDETLQNLQAKGDLEVKMNSKGLAIELIENESGGEAFFQLGSAIVRPKAKEMFAQLAPILALSKRQMEINGHTDANPMNRGGYDNISLSTDRANAVRILLMENGVPESQILEVRGKGSREPRVITDPLHFSNRRVSILLPYAAGSEAGPDGSQKPKPNLPSSAPPQPGVAPNLPDLRHEMNQKGH
ncbi:MAG: OmpA family protein [Fimbriimonadaceae bacterium]|jgi:chemotaxis protein MotB|nr:OmpA family protein [Fimbriimonadaceae bacterium]